MKTKQDVIAACLAMPFVYEDYPFDTETACMRHTENRKIFAMLCDRDGTTWINVKAEPMWGDFWRQTYRAVVPAYHCNKQHWISIVLDGSMNREEILRLLQDSYELTKPKRKNVASKATERAE